MFSCDVCGPDGLSEYVATFIDGDIAEICESCLEMFTRDGEIALAERFAGLAPLPEIEKAGN